MNSETTSPFLLPLDDAARLRLADVHGHTLAPYRLSVALPASYLAKRRHRYPLVLILDACDAYGSAVEMSRLMTQTKEIRDCIIIGIETPADAGVAALAGYITDTLLPWCRAHYRIAPEPAAVFSAHAGRATALAHACSTDGLRAIGEQPRAAGAGGLLPALVQGLRDVFGTGHEYGSEITVLQQPLLMHALTALAPLLRRLRAKPAHDAAPNPHLLWSERLQRNFEIFAVLPPSAATQPQRRYPALFVLDANIEFATVAETAARLAASGETAEIAVIGIGVPRAEGATEFGFRRFEEFSPPADGYDFGDALGRIFRSLFALRGQDARLRIGQAPGFYSFVTAELLPQLAAQLPLDTQRLGLLGHSAGGTFAGYALAQADSPFRDYAGISPGIGISGNWLTRCATRVSAQAQKVFLCIGSEENSNRFNRIAGIPDTHAYAQQLRAQAGLRVHYHCFEGETHSSVYAVAVTQALMQFYSRNPMEAA